MQQFEAERAVLKRQAAERAMLPGAEPRATTGSVRGLVLLVQFSDEKFTYSNADFNNMMNQSGYNYNGAIGSVRDYFVAQSGGAFTPTFDVYGPITLSHNEAYYGADGTGGAHDVNIAERLPADACDAANGIVDFSRYDGDGDGYVDLLYIVYAGYSQSSSGYGNDIWPRSGDAETGYFDKWDGKKISRFACSSEMKGSEGGVRDGIATFIHEYSHTLGLPDFYDTVSGATYGMGFWDIMCYGSYVGSWGVGYTAYERAFCGWLTLEELPATATSVSLGNLADTKKAYKMSSGDANQYFVLENRQKTGWDANLPSSGLMITKVDYNSSIWAPYGAVGTANRVNVDPNRQRMTIMPADNNCSFDSEGGDLYPYNGNNSFTPNSTPASITNTAGTINKPITNITNNNGVISFDVNGGQIVATPVMESVTVSGENIKAKWNAVSGASRYNLMVTRTHLAGGFQSEVYKEVQGITSTSYTLYNVSKGFSYAVSVQAENSEGKRSGFSESKSVTIEAAGQGAYKVTFDAASHGTFIVRRGSTVISSGTEVAAGTILSVIPTPDTGYELDAISVNGTPISGYSFTVNSSVSIAVTFKPLEGFTPPPFKFEDFEQAAFGTTGNCGKVISVTADGFNFGPYPKEPNETGDAEYNAQIGYVSPSHDITAQRGQKLELSVTINAAWGKFAIFMGDNNDNMQRVLLCGHELGWTPGGFVDTQFNDKVLFLEDKWETGAQTTRTRPFLQSPDYAAVGDTYLVRMMFFTPMDADLSNPDKWTFNATYREGHSLDFKVTVVAPPAAIAGTETANSTLRYANGKVYANEGGLMTVYNASGMQVKQSSAAVVDVADLPKGVYVAVINGMKLKFLR